MARSDIWCDVDKPFKSVIAAAFPPWMWGIILGFILLCVPCRNNVEWQIPRQANLQMGYVTQCQRTQSGGCKETENRIKWNLNSQVRYDKSGNMEFYWNQFNISKKVSGGDDFLMWYFNAQKYQMFKKSPMVVFQRKMLTFFTWTSLILGEYFILQKLSKT